MFENLTVIELSTVLAGPAVGMFFAELGAKVIKAEHPQVPDVTRSWKLPGEFVASSVSAYFSAVNYRKTYMTLNLGLPAEHAELMRLIAGADVLLVNFKKGDDRKFGLTSEELWRINPALIIGKITGFGNNSDRVAYDLILQAETGFMSMNGTPESGPVKMPVALIDILAAHQLKEGILVSLIKRLQNGKGSEVSVSLYDAAVASLANQASNYLMEGKIAERIGSLHPNIAPYGELFLTKDGQFITFAIGSNRHFAQLAGFLGLENLADDPKFSENQQRVIHREVLRKLLQERISAHNAEELLHEMNKRFVPMGVVRDLKQVFDQPESGKLVREEFIGDRDTKRVTTIAFNIHDNDQNT